MNDHVCGLTPEQYDILMKPINGTRIAKRSQGGKQLSYLESWDVRAHLIRVFGFLGFDAETIETHHVADRAYENNGKDMVEVVWFARFHLVVKCTCGRGLASFIESAVGSASGPASMLGEHHDNAAKTAASDALKRCAINLGSQFGLSLYDGGSQREVIKKTLVHPEGVSTETQATPEQAAALENSVGVKADTPEQVEAAVAEAKAKLGATEVKQETAPKFQDEHGQDGGVPVVGVKDTAIKHAKEAPESPMLNTSSKLAKAMYAAFGNQSEIGTVERIPYISKVIGREIGTTKEMTEAEAHVVLDALTAKQGASA